MADKKDAPKKEKDEAVGGEKVKSGKRDETKVSRWTVAMCHKFAKRFHTENDWAKGAPSSYKAALARGFMTDCTKHMAAMPAKKKSA